MGKLLEQVKKSFETMTDEELDSLMEELKPYSNIGPTVEEYIAYVKEINEHNKDNLE